MVAPSLSVHPHSENDFQKYSLRITLVPLDNASVTAICGCISVGNPGYGNVLMFVDSRRLSLIHVLRHRILQLLLQFRLIFAEIASKCFGITFLIIMPSPFVATAAVINVPASIWSGMMEY